MYEKWSIGINIIVILLMAFSVVKNIRKNKTSIFSYDFQIKFYTLYILPLVFVIINILINILLKLSITFWLVTVIIPIMIPIVSFLIDNKDVNKIRDLHSKYNLDIKSFIEEIFESKEIKITTDNIYVFLNYQDDIIYCKVVLEKDLQSLESNNLIKILREELSNKYPEIKFDIIIEK